MQREDYLIREISKISEFLLALMGKLQRKEVHQEAFSDGMKAQWGFDFETILNTPTAELSKILDPNKGFNAQNIELLADVMAENEQKQWKEKALSLYLLASQIDRTFSLERDYKEQQLKHVLDH